MLACVKSPNLRAPSWLSEKLTAGRLFSSSVGRALRRSRPVTAGDAAHHVVTGAGRLAGRGFDRARQDLHVGRHVVAERLPRRVLVRERALLDQLQLELRGRADDLLGAVHVGHAGQLHQDLVGGAVARHDRLGDAQLVDAALDRLQRLVHRVVAQLVDDVRLEREGVACRRSATAVVVDVDLGQRVAERRILVGRTPATRELRRARSTVDAADGDVRGLQLLAQPVGRGLASRAAARRRSGRAAPGARRPSGRGRAGPSCRADRTPRPPGRRHRRMIEDFPTEVLRHDLCVRRFDNGRLALVADDRGAGHLDPHIWAICSCTDCVAQLGDRAEEAAGGHDLVADLSAARNVLPPSSACFFIGSRMTK